jgi:hypothetical protein
VHSPKVSVCSWGRTGVTGPAESLALAQASLYASGMRILPGIVLIGLVVVPGFAVAKPRQQAKSKAAHVASKVARRAAPSAVRYLGGDPIGPLAVVRDGKVNKPSSSACRSWGQAGSRWTELDAYGRPAGDVVVTGGERYDVTNCDELRVKRTKGRGGAGVYVALTAASPTSPYEPSRLGEASREDLERAALSAERAVKEVDSGVKKAPRAMLVFQERKSGARFAVVGGRALVIARWDGSRWVVEHVQKPIDKQAIAGAYKPRAVVDMTHDGQPSIVFHVLEGFGETYFDETLVRSKDGHWHTVEAGIHGSTA